MVAESCDPAAACKAKSVPVPESAMTCGLPPTLSVMESWPERAPVCFGVNPTATLHCAPIAMEEQFVVSLKSPVALTAVTVSGPVPEFVSTTLFVLLAVPKSWLPNASGLVARLRMGVAFSPVPDRDKVRGLFAALELMVSVPLLAPTALGMNTMFSVQVA
jgi:hypothetical protein